MISHFYSAHFDLSSCPSHRECLSTPWRSSPSANTWALSCRARCVSRSPAPRIDPCPWRSEWLQWSSTPRPRLSKKQGRAHTLCHWSKTAPPRSLLGAECNQYHRVVTASLEGEFFSLLYLLCSPLHSKAYQSLVKQFPWHLCRDIQLWREVDIAWSRCLTWGWRSECAFLQWRIALESTHSCFDRQ